MTKLIFKVSLCLYLSNVLFLEKYKRSDLSELQVCLLIFITSNIEALPVEKDLKSNSKTFESEITHLDIEIFENEPNLSLPSSILFKPNHENFQLEEVGHDTTNGVEHIIFKVGHESTTKREPEIETLTTEVSNNTEVTTIEEQTPETTVIPDENLSSHSTEEEDVVIKQKIAEVEAEPVILTPGL